jgi:hypothetical protein
MINNVFVIKYCWINDNLSSFLFSCLLVFVLGCCWMWRVCIRVCVNLHVVAMWMLQILKSHDSNITFRILPKSENVWDFSYVFRLKMFQQGWNYYIYIVQK